jgi:hypothetical protein
MVKWTRNDTNALISELLCLVPPEERTVVKTFLSAIELTPDHRVSPGMWNKLYALLALAREKAQRPYWIYVGTLSVYDVTNRVIEARAIEDSHTFGEMILSKGAK